jgi:hypothetical protein
MQGNIFSDIVSATSKSILESTSAHIFTDGNGWDHVYSMPKKQETGYKLSTFIDDVQMIPQLLITDGCMEEKGGN